MRRWTVRVLCWLTLGAAVNLAVAWGTSLWPNGRPMFRPGDFSTRGQWLTPSYLEAGLRDPDKVAFASSAVCDTYIADWNGQNVFAAVLVWHFGLPMRTMSRGTVIRASGATETTRLDSIVLPLPHGGGVVIPIGPLWCGLVVNTLSYSALFGCIQIVPVILRRMRRRRKCLCVHCAYPVGDTGKPCSECGKDARA